MSGSDAAIIGAGPAGLKAAEVLAEAGVQVTVFEKMPSPARKFLMAGRGGLNLTHTEPLESFLTRYGEEGEWLRSKIDALAPHDLRAWSAALGQPTFEGSSGRVFPESFKASPLLRAWLRRLDELGVKLETRKGWTGWTDDGALSFADGSTFKPAVTVLALGGASWPRLGADGGWVRALRDRGVRVNELRSSNAGITVAWSQQTVERFAGVPLKRIAITVSAETVAGEAMVSRTGLEGGAVYALSRQLREVADAACGKPFEVKLDLKPGLDAEALAARLAKVPRKQSLTNRLRKGAGLSPQAISVWRDFTPHVPADDVALAHSIKSVTLMATGIQPLERAISSAGGIALDELDDGLMLNRLPGVFACGEMLDWDAPTGGYLLQACFATGNAAGRGALAWLKQNNAEQS
ncbi:MAG: TIGR03862 family flavoprotein [Anderseniella sp.]|nr:TIGR03862 family flavoprotein [Anderseniella sp.]